MEGNGGDGDASPNTEGPSAQATGPAPAAMHEAQGDQSASASASSATTPCRMKLRSQDSTRSDQASFKQMKGDQLNKLGLYAYVNIKQNYFTLCITMASVPGCFFFYLALVCVTE